jgi:hypothetical protein
MRVPQRNGLLSMGVVVNALPLSMKHGVVYDVILQACGATS